MNRNWLAVWAASMGIAGWLPAVEMTMKLDPGLANEIRAMLARRARLAK